jgi:hypothetical protein
MTPPIRRAWATTGCMPCSWIVAGPCGWAPGRGSTGAIPAVGGSPDTRRNPGSPVQLIDSSIFALLEDDEGRLWMGSTPGISVLDAGRTGIRHHYHRYRTFRYGWGEAIEMLRDRTGRFWISTHSELMRFDPRTGAFQYLRPTPSTSPASTAPCPRRCTRIARR